MAPQYLNTEKFLEEIKARFPDAQTFKFGDSPQLCDALVDLVKAGKKTATCDDARNYPGGSPAIPVVGRRDIALYWDSRPAVLIETVEVTHQRFCDVTEDFALAEGENTSLGGWRAVHKAYFARNGGFDPDMMLICERFRVIEVLG